jgi:hypothetical protein
MKVLLKAPIYKEFGMNDIRVRRFHAGDPGGSGSSRPVPQPVENPLRAAPPAVRVPFTAASSQRDFFVAEA